MRLLKTVQTLTLSTVLVLVLSACHQKDHHNTNTTTQTGSAMQEGGASDAFDSVGTNTQPIDPTLNNGTNAQIADMTPNGSNASAIDSDNNSTSGGSDDNSSTGGGTHTVTLKSLKLEIANTTLNRDHNTTITLQALYDDNSTNTPTNIEWLTTPKDAVSIQGNTLTALKDTNVTIQAKAGNTLSNQVHLTIYWEVSGHRLPPEPDPKVNNATLLGVDVNHNGVRDDVERWIYNRYKEYVPCHQIPDGNYTLPSGRVIPLAKTVCEDHPVPYHPVVRAVAMQGARAAQIIIQHPKKAQEILPVWNAALFCSFALRDFKDDKQRKLYKKYIFGDDFKKIQFNTVQRARAFGEFNFYLSGGAYSSPSHDVMLKECDDNVKKYLKDLK